MKQIIDGHEIDVPAHLMPAALIEASDQHEENIKRKLDAHDDLVKALQAATKEIDSQDSQNHPYEQYGQLLAQMRAALAKAGVSA